MSKLWESMLAAQKEIKHAVKDSKNPHLKNTYASLASVLDAVKPILNKHGLVLTQHVGGNTQFVQIQTKITHAEDSENCIIDALPVPIKHKYSKDGVDIGPDAQELGSAITYGRRYGLLAMLAIASEDDDGELAVVGTTGPSSGGAQPSPQISKEQQAEISGKLTKAIGWKPVGG